MESLKNIFQISDKPKRYDELVKWIFSEIFQNKIALLELHKFSEERKIRKNGKKLLACVIFSPDPESSAWRGPSIEFRIFERQDSAWRIDLRFRPLSIKSKDQLEKDIDLENFINPERILIFRKFIHPS